MSKVKYSFYLIIILLIVSSITYMFITICIEYILENNIKKASVPIDVVFVAAPKDFEVLPYSVESVQKYLMQPINKLVLISPKSEEAVKLANALGMEFIDENDLLNRQEFFNWINVNKLKKNYPEGWTWYYQQFLKLLYYKISVSQYYFIMDADVIINRPLVLVSDDKIRTFFIGQNAGHEISKTSIKSLLGEEQYVPEFSFIADLMCFDKDIVKSMVNKIENKFGMDLYKAGILVEQNTTARFSEYEMYGVYANYSSEYSKLLTNYAHNFTYSRKRTTLFLDKYFIWLKKYPYISYHAYLNN